MYNVCQYNFRKGKTKPFDLIAKNQTDSYINFFTSMGNAHETINEDIASEFVCRMYSQSKTQDVNEARYNKLIQMTGKVDKVKYIICDNKLLSHLVLVFKQVFVLFVIVISL